MDEEYVTLYEQKYLEFMLDPSVETVTNMERDLWHEMTIAQIRVMQLLEKEKEPVYHPDTGMQVKVSYHNEIRNNQRHSIISWLFSLFRPLLCTYEY